jgi:hypothetical protein
MADGRNVLSPDVESNPESRITSPLFRLAPGDIGR